MHLKELPQQAEMRDVPIEHRSHFGLLIAGCTGNI
jgi:hypothetical protein